MKLGLYAFAVLIGLPISPLRAQSIYIATDASGGSICTEPPSSFPAQFTLYVLADGGASPPGGGIVGARFAIDGFEGITGPPPNGPYFVFSAIPNPASHVVIGDPLGDGAAISFPGCQTGHAVLLYTITVINFGDTQIRPITIAASTGESCPEVVFCDAPIFTEACAYPGTALLNVLRVPPPATDPHPADGAVGVPLQVTLEWHIPPVQSETCEVGTLEQEIFFGTSPNPPHLDYSSGQRYYTTPPLAPSTTYYWRIEAGGNTSPVWSFTTDDKVAAQPVTWSAVRSLYR